MYFCVVWQQRAGDDILWSADVILFEDELHDHGVYNICESPKDPAPEICFFMDTSGYPI